MSRPVFIVTASGQPDGMHTGRMRLRVFCLACMRLLHEATTGAQTRMETHLARGCKNDDCVSSDPIDSVTSIAAAVAVAGNVRVAEWCFCDGELRSGCLLASEECGDCGACGRRIRTGL